MASSNVGLPYGVGACVATFRRLGVWVYRVSGVLALA
jgi:hypothetical protein